SFLCLRPHCAHLPAAVTPRLDAAPEVRRRAQEDAMTATATGPVVCGYDGSDDARRAVAWAAIWARDHGTTLEVISADRAGGRVGAFDETARTNVIGAMREEVAGLVVDGQASYRGSAAVPARARLEAGGSASALGVGRRGLAPRADFALGSTSAGVVEHATCPVIVITPRPPERPAGGPVVLAADGSPNADPAAAFAFTE